MARTAGPAPGRRYRTIVYRYVAYDKNGQVAKGKLSATSEAAATELLGYSGYQIVNLRALSRRLDMERTFLGCGSDGSIPNGVRRIGR